MPVRAVRLAGTPLPACTWHLHRTPGSIQLLLPCFMHGKLGLMHCICWNRSVGSIVLPRVTSCMRWEVQAPAMHSAEQTGHGVPTLLPHTGLRLSRRGCCSQHPNLRCFGLEADEVLK